MQEEEEGSSVQSGRCLLGRKCLQREPTDESIHPEGMSGVLSKHRAPGEGSCARELRDYEKSSPPLACSSTGPRHRGTRRGQTIFLYPQDFCLTFAFFFCAAFTLKLSCCCFLSAWSWQVTTCTQERKFAGVRDRSLAFILKRGFFAMPLEAQAWMDCHTKWAWDFFSFETNIHLLLHMHLKTYNIPNTVCMFF